MNFTHRPGVRVFSTMLIVSWMLLVWCGLNPQISDAQNLTILAEDAAPLNFLAEGEVSGSSVEIVQEILRRLDIEASIEIVPWARGYQRARNEPNVVLFSVARSNDRESLFHWVGPLVRVQNAFYASSKTAVVIDDIEDARRVGRIGTRRADMRESYLQSLGFDNLDSTNSNQSNLRKLLDGRIDLWATSNIEAINVAVQHGIHPTALKHIFTFQTFFLYIAISKRTSPVIAREWQAVLDEMKASSVFMTVSRKWLPDSSLPDAVTQPSEEWRQAPKIAIYTENSPPGNYVDNGQLQGPAVRVVEEILRRTGSSSKIEVVPWARGYHMAQRGPNVALFSTSRLPQREKLFKWVGPLYTQRWGFYARKESSLDISSMADARQVARIGTYREDAKEQYLKALGFPNLVNTNNNIGNVKHLLEGAIDLWVSSDFNMPYIVRYAGHDPRQLRLVLSFKTVGNYIAFSLLTDDHIVMRWQKTLDAIRHDGTWSRYFSDGADGID